LLPAENKGRSHARRGETNVEERREIQERRGNARRRETIKRGVGMPVGMSIRGETRELRGAWECP